MAPSGAVTGSMASQPWSRVARLPEPLPRDASRFRVDDSNQHFGRRLGAPEHASGPRRVTVIRAMPSGVTSRMAISWSGRCNACQHRHQLGPQFTILDQPARPQARARSSSAASRSSIAP